MNSRLATRGLLSIDIAQAITELVAVPQTRLPLALTKEQVLEQLLIIVETDEEGARHKLEAGIRLAVHEKFDNRLTNSSLFQAGYKRYEEEAKNPVVPVTKFFFTSVYDGADAINHMSEFDVKHSLPKRPNGGLARDPETGEEIDNDKVIKSGPIAGIVIFPPNYGSRRREGENPVLLQSWLARAVNGAEGAALSAGNRLVYARPDAKSAIGARDNAKTVGPDMRRALPRVP